MGYHVRDVEGVINVMSYPQDGITDGGRNSSLHCERISEFPFKYIIPYINIHVCDTWILTENFI